MIEAATSPRRSALRRYHDATRSATYGFLAALPLLVLYEVAIVLANEGRLQQIRVGADVWTKQLLAAVGATGLVALGVGVVLVGALVLWRERKARVPLRARYFGGLVAESAVYAVVLAFMVSGVVGAIFAAAPGLVPLQAATPLGQQGVGMKLALSIGAGLYEELVFRVVLVGGLFWLLSRWMASRRGAYLVAALVGALVFSAVHYLGALGDPFALGSFTFRFLFGLALNAVFLVRGFGAAAWTHALYDVFLTLGFL